MTTLRSFQAEIENISHEKQRIAIDEAKRAHLASELAKHHGKLPPKKEAITEVHIEEHVPEVEEVEEKTLEVSLISALTDRIGLDS